MRNRILDIHAATTMTSLIDRPGRSSDRPREIHFSQSLIQSILGSLSLSLLSDAAPIFPSWQMSSRALSPYSSRASRVEHSLNDRLNICTRASTIIPLNLPTCLLLHSRVFLCFLYTYNVLRHVLALFLYLYKMIDCTCDIVYFCLL